MAKKKPTTELVTVPMFTFNQGDVFSGEGNIERPIQVRYYNGSIELVQDGDYDKPDSILICHEFVKQLFTEIMAHMPEAQKRWDK